MPYLKKIVLHSHRGYHPQLEELVEEFIRDGVIFVGVVGNDCQKIEDMIDEIVVGNGDRDASILASSHPKVSLAEAVDFARNLTGEFDGEVEVVEI